MSYERVFQDSFRSLMEKYSREEVRFLDENSLRSALFFECLDEILRRNLDRKIEPNAAVVPGKGWKADLVLGDREVACELKFEPRYPLLLGWVKKRPVVIWREVEEDIRRLKDFVRTGVKFAHFIMVDEDGWWRSKEVPGGWSVIPQREWSSNLAEVTLKS